MEINSKNTVKEALTQMKKHHKTMIYFDEGEKILTWQNMIDLYLNQIDINTPLSNIDLHKSHDTEQKNISIDDELEIYQETLENIPLSIFISNADGEIVYLNKKFEKTTNTKRKDIIGKSFSYIKELNLFWPAITPLVLHEKRELSITQKIIESGQKTVVTGIPLFDDNQNIKCVVTVSRELQREELEVNNKSVNMPQLKNKTLIFKSEQMRDIIHLTKQISNVLSTVLITGESGVGKDVIAELIHEQSDRQKQSFITINCGAIPEALLESELFGYETGAFSGASKEGKKGLIEAAHNGTLFLDEIGEMPLNLQVKLLQVLQKKHFTRVGGTKSIEVDIRIIAATNSNLTERVENGQFRLDLFYRLNVIPIYIPPLRDRAEDILPMAKLLLNKYSTEHEKDLNFTLQFEKELMNYKWPGNIRELDNLIERLVVTSEEKFIEKHDLRDNLLTHSASPVTEKHSYNITVQKIAPLKETLDYIEDKLVNMAYSKNSNSYEVAKLLDISQSSAHRKIQKYIK